MSRRQKFSLSPLFLLAIGLAFTLIGIFSLRYFSPLPQIALIDTPSDRYLIPLFSDIKVTSDIQFGTTPALRNRPGKPLLLDIYEPTDDLASDRAAIIWIHGGSFNQGDKTDFSQGVRGFGPMYSQLGYVGFAINYRLDNQEHTWNEKSIHPALDNAVADTHLAMQYIVDHATEYRINPNNIILAGTSAGAITALYAGYDHPPVTPAAIISISGAIFPSNFPLLSPSSPPTIILHGEKDHTVPYSAAQTLRDQLLTLNAIHEFHSFPKLSHNVVAEPSIHPLIQTFLYQQLDLVPSPSPSLSPLPSEITLSSVSPSITPSIIPSAIPVAPSPTPALYLAPIASTPTYYVPSQSSPIPSVKPSVKPTLIPSPLPTSNTTYQVTTTYTPTWEQPLPSSTPTLISTTPAPNFFQKIWTSLLNFFLTLFN